MPDKKFDMSDYVPVNERIEAFYVKHPEGSLQSEIVELTPERVTVKAYAYRFLEDTRPGIGHSSLDIPGSTPYTKGSEIENCETSAWGRAIAALGFEVKRGIATKEDVRNKQPEQGERGRGTTGVRTPAKTPAPAPRTRGDALNLIAEAGRDHGWSFQQIESKAKELGIERGKAAIEDLMLLYGAIVGNAEGAPSPSATVQPPEGPEGAAPATPTLDDVLALTGGEVVDE